MNYLSSSPAGHINTMFKHPDRKACDTALDLCGLIFFQTLELRVTHVAKSFPQISECISIPAYDYAPMLSLGIKSKMCGEDIYCKNIAILIM